MKSVAQLLKVKGTVIHSISPRASVLECLKLFADKGIGAALVMEGDRLVGIFTERDYARKGAADEELASQRIAEQEAELEVLTRRRAELASRAPSKDA